MYGQTRGLMGRKLFMNLENNMRADAEITRSNIKNSQLHGSPES